MRKPAAARGTYAYRVFAIPTLLALLSALGLLSALLGDGVWDVLSWLTLGALIVTIVRHVARPARARYERS
ncbi:hypothetical protein [Rhodospirillaceae bacterium SYSU D60014]|uniref:hypothetical protein n=1 Tax=Virgifigura deserti TaxID=2268457 RepID=UPI000E66809A